MYRKKDNHGQTMSIKHVWKSKYKEYSQKSDSTKDVASSIKNNISKSTTNQVAKPETQAEPVTLLRNNVYSRIFSDWRKKKSIKTKA